MVWVMVVFIVVEFNEYGICVNFVSFGYVCMVMMVLFFDFFEGWKDEIMNYWVVEFDDIMGVCVFLVSDVSWYV